MNETRRDTTAEYSSHLTMPIGEAIFTMRAIRRQKSDPIPDEHIRDILEAATRAPSGSNRQKWHFMVVKDREQRRKLGDIFRTSRDLKFPDQPDFESIPDDNLIAKSGWKLAQEISDSPVIIVVCATDLTQQAASSVITATQNMMLAARAHGIGGTFSVFHKDNHDDVRALLGIPPSVQIVFCIPLGYPRGKFGPVDRKPVSEVMSLDHWGNVPDWAK